MTKPTRDGASFRFVVDQKGLDALDRTRGAAESAGIEIRDRQELIRKALTAYTEIVELQTAGGTVVFRKPDGREEGIAFV